MLPLVGSTCGRGGAGGSVCSLQGRERGRVRGLNEAAGVRAKRASVLRRAPARSCPG